MFHIEHGRDGVAVVRFEVPNQSTNTLGPEAIEELYALVEGLAGQREHMAGVVFTSGREDIFCAGADLFALREMSRHEVSGFLERGQRVLQRIAELRIPTVAAINGNCLGGGLELALACRYRVSVDSGSIRIGLPEVNLGILPAWGGTSRLARLVGLPAALPLLLGGRMLAPRQALKAGILDEVVRAEALLAAAKRYVRHHPRRRHPAPVTRVVRVVPPLRNLVLSTAERRVRERTYGHYPAPLRILEVLRRTVQGPLERGLQAEREAALELSESSVCRNLMRLFFLRHEAKKAARQIGAEPVAVEHAAVIGGGTMGAGIAHALARGGMRVRLVEVDHQAVAAALRRIRGHLEEEQRGKRLTALEARRVMHRICPTTQWDGLGLADLVVEAVVEREQVKREVFERLDRLTRPEAVLASNTSSLSIARLAEAVQDPARVVGLHFFNPVPRMPLVELVQTPSSGAGALATVARVADRIGKVPICVSDGPGFLVNRVLIPYLAEALNMVAEVGAVDRIDRAMKQWGMPMGPLELLDQVGLDVAIDIFHAVGPKLGDHIAVPEGLDGLLQRGWLGRKSGRGFYVYGGRRRRGGPPVHGELVAMLRRGGGETPAQLDERTIQDRCVLPMVNEAARLLSEGVVESTDLIDLATVLGIGFAPFRGGLVRFAESEGLLELVNRMDELARQVGPRFLPLPLLREAAQESRPMRTLGAQDGSFASSHRVETTPTQ